MRLSITQLLLHSDSVPTAARDALRAAFDVPVEERQPHLELAAQILSHEAELGCHDARELVGLDSCGC